MEQGDLREKIKRLKLDEGRTVNKDKRTDATVRRVRDGK